MTIKIEGQQPKHVQTKRNENRRATQHEHWNYIKAHGRAKYDNIVRAGQRTI